MRVRRRPLLLFLIVLILLAILYAMGRKPVKSAVYIESDKDARVIVDGFVEGNTPLTLETNKSNINLQIVPLDTALSPYETALSLTPSVKTIVRRNFGVSSTGYLTELISFEKETEIGAFLTVVTKPSDAKISVNNLEFGKSNLKLKFSPDRYSVRAEHPGYQPRNLDVQLLSGFNTTLYIELSPLAPPSP